MLTTSLARRHHDPNDRDHMAPFRCELHPRRCALRQATKPDWAPHLCARSSAEVEDKLLNFTGRVVLPNPRTVLHTQA